jgi:hypothetical protein
MNYIIVIAVLLFHFTSWSWSPETISLWNNTNYSHGQIIIGPSFGTFWGGMRRGFHWREHKGSLVEVRPPGFIKNIPIYLQHNKKKRNLIIFYPGVFGRPDGVISPQVIDELEKSDVHVAVIPNLLAATYLIGRPKMKGDPIELEKENQRKLISEVLNKIGKKNIHKIHVIAESLGCLQALSAMRPTSNSVPIESLTLLWPALFMKNAIDRFDHLIAESVFKKDTCSYWWKWPQIFVETKLYALPTGMNQQDKDCLGFLVIGYGFVKSIKENAEEYFSEKKLPFSSLPESFGEFISMVTPEMSPFIHQNDPRLSVEVLLGYFRGFEKKIRIASSINDFLNRPHEWESLKKRHPKLISQIYLFSWGGHSGPIGMEGFFDNIYK